MIYLDYNATTPVSNEAMQAMMPFFQNHFGNSMSQNPFGWSAHQAIEKARGQVASLIHAKSQEIFFTSGATESNNWAILGLIRKLKKQNPNEKIHLITSTIEHNSILSVFKTAVAIDQVEISIIPVDEFGIISLTELKKAIQPHTKLISVMFANNEIGTIQPILEIGKVCKENQIYFHVDATQGIGKFEINVDILGIDLLSFSSHKIYGPKGIGALYIRQLNPHVDIEPFIYGGGHERGLRSGTLNTPAIVGFGIACEICQNQMTKDQEHYKKLAQLFYEEITSFIPSAIFLGHPQLRIMNTISLHLPGVRFELISSKLVRLAVSPGSACSAQGAKPSHVLRSIGLSDKQAAETMRISLGRQTTKEQILIAAELISMAVNNSLK